MEMAFRLEEETMEAKVAKTLAEARQEPLDQTAVRFVRFAVAGLAAQGDVDDAQAARTLLRALKKWFGADWERELAVFEEEELT